jgi:hypothetical protein
MILQVEVGCASKRMTTHKRHMWGWSKRPTTYYSPLPFGGEQFRVIESVTHTDFGDWIEVRATMPAYNERGTGVEQFDPAADAICVGVTQEWADYIIFGQRLPLCVRHLEREFGCVPAVLYWRVL